MLTPYDKTIIAAIMTLLIFVLSTFDIQIPENVQNSIITVLGVALPLAVYLVPNKQPAQPGDIQAYITELEARVSQAEAGAEVKTVRKKASGDSG